jgi:glycosyltransferase involved in cell wall biosynthesis
VVAESAAYVHDIAIVIPVYRGEETLRPLIAEILGISGRQVTPDGAQYEIREVLLVYDNGPDDSAATMRGLAQESSLVRPIWLSRNFGQHAATLAGIASSAATWIVTMDEDGQHNPKDISTLLDVAIRDRAQLVYGRHAEGAPHARWRNVTSSLARRAGRWMAGSDLSRFSSFRLILGSHGRAVAAYCGPRTYLDSALAWAISGSSEAVVSTRPEWRSDSGYSLGRLMSHFWTLVLSSGTRPLRIVSFMGLFVAFGGFVGAIIIAIRQLKSDIDVPGWASVVTTVLVMCGLILFALGVVAEYVGALLKTAQGRPLYVIVDDPNDGPLGR